MNFLRIPFLLLSLFTKLSITAQTTFPETLFHTDTLKYWVNVFADDSLKGRLSGSKESITAANIIADEFKRVGVKPVAGNLGYFMSLGKYGYNVVGGLQGKSKSGELIIFSAHYDHIGTWNTNPYPELRIKEGNDTIYNGANDNASGVVALLRLAKYYAEQGNNERTLLFIAFGAEELGLLGSLFLADNLEVDSVKANINIEMIGRSEKISGRPFLTGDDLSNLYSILNKQLYGFDKKKFGKNFIQRDPFKTQELFMRSDNYPFAKKGIPAHTIMTIGAEDRFYHTLHDEPGTIDYELMRRIITAMAIAARGLVAGTDTPTRIR